MSKRGKIILIILSVIAIIILYLKFSINFCAVKKAEPAVTMDELVNSNLQNLEFITDKEAQNAATLFQEKKESDNMSYILIWPNQPGEDMNIGVKTNIYTCSFADGEAYISTYDWGGNFDLDKFYEKEKSEYFTSYNMQGMFADVCYWDNYKYDFYKDKEKFKNTVEYKKSGDALAVYYGKIKLPLRFTQGQDVSGIGRPEYKEVYFLIKDNIFIQIDVHWVNSKSNNIIKPLLQSFIDETNKKEQDNNYQFHFDKSMPKTEGSSVVFTLP